MLRRQTTTEMPIGRLFRGLVGDLITVVGFAVITIGLVRLELEVIQPASAPEFEKPLGSGVIIRSEILYVCLPQVLIDLAKCELESHVDSKYEDWKTALERHGHENICYELLVRGHQINGRSADITFVRYPHREPEHFQELVDVLATASGRPPVGNPALDYSRTTIQIAPTGSSRGEILDRIKALSPTVFGTGLARFCTPG